MSFTAATPKPRYPKQIKHLGDHLRARRIDLGFLQKEVAGRIGVDTAAVTNWELGKTVPADRFIPALIGFLGYDPLPEAETPGEGVRRARWTRALTIRSLADLAGVDEASLSHLEEGSPGVYPSVATKIWKALGL